MARKQKVARRRKPEPKPPMMLKFHLYHHADPQQLCLLERILELQESIMSAISEFAAKQNAHNEKINTAVTGLQDDVQTLNDKIAELQATQGAITPEDQALLDEIEAASGAVAAKLEALDALTPPKPPTA